LETLTVEHGLVFGLVLLLIGAVMIGVVIVQWWNVSFGPLDYPSTMRWVVPGVTLAAIGFQTMMAGLMAGVLRMQPRKSANRRTSVSG
jgi:hypothetical protein